jgi:hypothetical protein
MFLLSRTENRTSDEPLPSREIRNLRYPVRLRPPKVFAVSRV